MIIKGLIAYAVLLVIVFFYHYFPFRVFDYLIPLYLLSVPVILKGGFRFSLSLRNLLLSIVVSSLVLIPFYFVFLAARTFKPLAANFILTQLLAVSFPEEVFFRGFLQDRMGNDLKSVFIVSLMFSAAHLPGLLFYGDLYAPMTFFPSVVMGLLYMKTSDVMPSTVFHFFANVVFLGFMI